MIENIKKDIINLKTKNFRIGILKSDKEELVDTVMNKVKEEFLDLINLDEIVLIELSTEQYAHMGPGSFGIAIMPKIK